MGVVQNQKFDSPFDFVLNIFDFDTALPHLQSNFNGGVVGAHSLISV